MSAAAVLIDRVLDSVHEDLSRLLNDDNLLLRFLDVARHHLAGRDEAAELQVCRHDCGPVICLSCSIMAYKYTFVVYASFSTSVDCSSQAVFCAMTQSRFVATAGGG